MQSQALLHLLDPLYSAAAGTQSWERFLLALSEALRGQTAVLLSRDFDTDDVAFVVLTRDDPDRFVAYGEYYGGINAWKDGEECPLPGHTVVSKNLCEDNHPDTSEFHNESLRPQDLFNAIGAINAWMERAERPAAGTPVVSQAPCDADYMVMTEFYSDWLRPQNLLHAIGWVIVKDGQWCSKFSILRSRNIGFYSAQDLELCRDLLPHMQRAIRIQERFTHLQMMNVAGIDALNCLPTATLLVSAAGRIIFTNRSADQIVARHDGVTIGKDGRLRSLRKAQEGDLDKLVAMSTKTDGITACTGGVVRINRAGKAKPYSVFVSPLRSNYFKLGYKSAAAIVFIFDPDEKSRLPDGLIAVIFGLTPAESRLAALIAAGKSVRECASRLRLTEGTVRQYLKSIFRKTDTSSQSELVNLILRSLLVFSSQTS